MDPIRIASTATRLIEANGVPVILEVVTVSDYDTSTSKVEAGKRNISGKGFPFEYDLRDIDGDMVRAGDVRVLLSVKADNGQDMPEPKKGFRMKFDGAFWNVERCAPIKLKGKVVVYDVQARK